MCFLSLFPGIAGPVLGNLPRREPQRKRPAQGGADQVLRKMWFEPSASSASK
jgi:hypothetical protein